MVPQVEVVLEFRTELTAAPEQVFRALTDEEQLSTWFCDSAAVNAMRGGSLSLTWHPTGGAAETFRGRWTVFQPPWACAYEGGHEGYPDGYAGRIGFDLSRRDGGTLLLTRHRLPARPDYAPFVERYRHAWPNSLARLVEALPQ